MRAKTVPVRRKELLRISAVIRLRLEALRLARADGGGDINLQKTKLAYRLR